jgi:hypothetical protein
MWRRLTHLVMTRGLSSVGRALPLQGRGQGFESPRLHKLNAQLKRPFSQDAPASDPYTWP